MVIDNVDLYYILPLCSDMNICNLNMDKNI